MAVWWEAEERSCLQLSSWVSFKTDEEEGQLHVLSKLTCMPGIVGETHKVMEMHEMAKCCVLLLFLLIYETASVRRGLLKRTQMQRDDR